MAKIDKVQEVDIRMLKPYEKNAKIHNQSQIQKIADSIEEFGFLNPILIDNDFNVIAGHGRLEASKFLNMDKVPCINIEGLTEQQRRAYILADNKLGELAEWDFDLVISELNDLKLDNFDIDLTGFDYDELLEEEKENPYDIPNSEKGSLNDRFIVPPFSILDSRQGYWIDRRKKWRILNDDKAVSRQNVNLMPKGFGTDFNSASLFDPVLAEICYKWFNVVGGSIFDCFAGGGCSWHCCKYAWL